MPCYSPLQGYRSRDVNPTGKRSIVFNASEALEKDRPIQIACGQCAGCRLERSRQWAMRCIHESKMHQNNCFITLTYDDDHLPKDGSLDKTHFQKFMKRLRKRFGKVRYFMCGEYGDHTYRPHYHACLFGLDFSDKKHWRTRDGHRLYNSEILRQLWPYGHSVIGDVTYESAAYVARYIMKKVLGKEAVHYYNQINYTTGEVIAEVTPEYCSMSLKPAIGLDWFKENFQYLIDHDFTIVNGKKVRPAKYYDKLLERDAPWEYEEIKEKRLANASKYASNNTPDRLDIREKILLEKVKQLKRGLEDET